MANHGRPSKGPRTEHTVRIPADHDDRYVHQAGQLGLSYSDYLALVLARAHDLDVPDYVARQLSRGEGAALGA